MHISITYDCMANKKAKAPMLKITQLPVPSPATKSSRGRIQIQVFLMPKFTPSDSFKCHPQDFLGGPAVKNPPCNVGDVGTIPGRGTKIPHAIGQLNISMSATATEPVCLN